MGVAELEREIALRRARNAELALRAERLSSLANERASAVRVSDVENGSAPGQGSPSAVPRRVPVPSSLPAAVSLGADARESRLACANVSGRARALRAVISAAEGRLAPPVARKTTARIKLNTNNGNRSNLLGGSNGNSNSNSNSTGGQTGRSGRRSTLRERIEASVGEDRRALEALREARESDGRVGSVAEEALRRNHRAHKASRIGLYREGRRRAEEKLAALRKMDALAGRRVAIDAVLERVCAGENGPHGMSLIESGEIPPEVVRGWIAEALPKRAPKKTGGHASGLDAPPIDSVVQQVRGSIGEIERAVRRARAVHDSLVAEESVIARSRWCGRGGALSTDPSRGGGNAGSNSKVGSNQGHGYYHASLSIGGSLEAYDIAHDVLTECVIGPVLAWIPDVMGAEAVDDLRRSADRMVDEAMARSDRSVLAGVVTGVSRDILDEVIAEMAGDVLLELRAMRSLSHRFSASVAMRAAASLYGNGDGDGNSNDTDESALRALFTRLSALNGGGGPIGSNHNNNNNAIRSVASVGSVKRQSGFASVVQTASVVATARSVAMSGRSGGGARSIIPGGTTVRSVGSSRTHRKHNVGLTGDGRSTQRRRERQHHGIMAYDEALSLSSSPNSLEQLPPDAFHRDIRRDASTSQQVTGASSACSPFDRRRYGEAEQRFFSQRHYIVVPLPRLSEETITTASFDPRGRMLAVGGSHGGLLVYDIGPCIARQRYQQVGEPRLLVVQPHADRTVTQGTGCPITRVTWSPDGMQLLSSDARGHIRLWSVASIDPRHASSNSSNSSNSLNSSNSYVPRGLRPICAVDGEKDAMVNGVHDPEPVGEQRSKAVSLDREAGKRTVAQWLGEMSRLASMTSTGGGSVTGASFRVAASAFWPAVTIMGSTGSIALGTRAGDLVRVDVSAIADGHVFGRMPTENEAKVHRSTLPMLSLGPGRDPKEPTVRIAKAVYRGGHASPLLAVGFIDHDPDRAVTVDANGGVRLWGPPPGANDTGSRLGGTDDDLGWHTPLGSSSITLITESYIDPNDTANNNKSRSKGKHSTREKSQRDNTGKSERAGGDPTDPIDDGDTSTATETIARVDPPVTLYKWTPSARGAGATVPSAMRGNQTFLAGQRAVVRGVTGDRGCAFWRTVHLPHRRRLHIWKQGREDPATRVQAFQSVLEDDQGFVLVHNMFSLVRRAEPVEAKIVDVTFNTAATEIITLTHTDEPALIGGPSLATLARWDIATMTRTGSATLGVGGTDEIACGNVIVSPVDPLAGCDVAHVVWGASCTGWCPPTGRSEGGGTHTAPAGVQIRSVSLATMREVVSPFEPPAAPATDGPGSESSSGARTAPSFGTVSVSRTGLAHAVAGSPCLSVSTSPGSGGINPAHKPNNKGSNAKGNYQFDSGCFLVLTGPSSSYVSSSPGSRCVVSAGDAVAMSLSRCASSPYELRATGFRHWAEDGDPAERRAEIAREAVWFAVEAAMEERYSAKGFYATVARGARDRDTVGQNEMGTTGENVEDDEYLERLMAQIAK